MNGKPWADAELDLLRRNYAVSKTEDVARALERRVDSVYRKAHSLGLRKSDAFFASGAAGRTDGIKGTPTRFKKGDQPWNTGMKGLQIGGVATRFKPGERQGTAADRYQPIGTEKVRDGYLVRKMRDDGPMHKRWEFVHRLIWAQHFDPIPDGHVVTFRNGNALDIRLDNLELITRTELSRRNQRLYPRELLAVMKLATRLRSKLNAQHQK